MELKCSMCNRDFDEFDRIPRLLPECGHSFCEKCIRNVIQERRNVFTCPIDNQSHVFRRDIDEVPKNMTIIKAVRDNKHNTLAKSRQVLYVKTLESQKQKTDNLCKDHQKLKQFRCKNDGKLICSHCAIFGQHKGHELEPATRVKYDDAIELIENVQKQLLKLECCTKEILESPNSLYKGLEKTRKQLKLQIKEIFKVKINAKQVYHETISRKQAQMERQIDQIIKQSKKSMTNIEDEIQQNLKTSNLIHQQVNLLKEDIRQDRCNFDMLGTEVQDLISRMNIFKPLVLKLDDQIRSKCRDISTNYKSKFRSVDFFKIQQFFHTFAEGKQNKSTNKSDQTSFNGELSRASQFIRTFNSAGGITPIKGIIDNVREKQRRPEPKISLNMSIKDPRDSPTLIRETFASNTDIPKETYLQVLNRQTGNSKHQPLKVTAKELQIKEPTKQPVKDHKPPRQSHLSVTEYEIKQGNSYGGKPLTINKRRSDFGLSRDKATSREKPPSQTHIKGHDAMSREKGVDRDKSPAHKDKKKDLKYEARQKIDNVLGVIQKQTGSNLELIGQDIKDYFIPDIFEYIRKNSRKYGLIKFVKNDITDEGMNMILTNLRNYEYVHTLNLTSNHLTESCLDSIIEFVGYNKILKNFYLTGNNINAMKVRQKKKLMQEMGINVYM